MSEEEPRRVQLTVTQVLAGAVAAMVGSLVASRLGVAGTILGAAVISVVATVLTAVNVNSMNHVRDRARTARRALAETRLAQTQQLRAEQAGHPSTEPVDDATIEALSQAEAADLAELAAIDEEEAHDPATAPGRWRLADRRGLHWGVIAGVSVLVFMVAMVGITVIEKITGQSIACSLGADCDRPTTIPLPRQTPNPPQSPSPTPTATGSQTPLPSVTVTVTPTPSATITPSETATPPASETPSPTGSPSLDQSSPPAAP